MAQYLWQTSLTSAAWKDLMARDASPIFGEGHRVAEEFGGSVRHSWVASAKTTSSSWSRCRAMRAWPPTCWR